jgi:hypothetical protein
VPEARITVCYLQRVVHALSCQDTYMIKKNVWCLYSIKVKSAYGAAGL